MSTIIKMEFYPLVQRKNPIITTTICIRLGKIYPFLSISKLLILNLKEIDKFRKIKRICKELTIISQKRIITTKLALIMLKIYKHLA